jgi:hypothetical protein
MNDLAKLHDELIIGHPVTGPYSADAATAAAEINAVNRTRIVKALTTFTMLHQTRQAWERLKQQIWGAAQHEMRPTNGE